MGKTESTLKYQLSNYHIYNLTTLYLNGSLPCVDFMDVIMGDIPWGFFGHQNRDQSIIQNFTEEKLPLKLKCSLEITLFL